MASNERVGITLDILPGTFAGVTAALGGFNELVAATSQFSTAIANSTSVMDAMILNVGVALVGAAWESAKAFGELERGMKITQAVSGQTSSQITILTQKANEFSVKYKLGIDDITAGLQTLGRAGLSNVNTQMDTMQAGLQTAKVEGMALNDALEKIVSTTTLLGGDLNSANFGKQAEKLTSQLLSTSMSAPIDVNDVVQTLSYSGGTAAAAGINIQNDDALYDYLGAISAFAQKGVKGSMAGTAMRAFFTKPASQDTSVIEAFNTLKMKPSDLWKDGGNAMRPISEQIGIIHEQMEKLNMSTLDQIELWGKIVGPKMGQQMMKLDEDTIKAASREIRQTSSATELANMTMDNFLSDIETLEQKSQRAWRGYGEAALAWIGPVVRGLNGLFDILGADIGGIPIFQQFVKMGIIIVISQVIQKLGAVKNLFVGIYQEMRNMLGTMSRSERTIEEQAVAEQKRLQTLGLTKDQAESLVSSESRVTGGLKTSNEVLAQFLVKLNEAVTLMSELATLSRSASMNAISNISTAQHNRAFMKDGTKGMRKTAWFDGLKGGDLTRNEFATLALRHGMNVEGKDGLLSIYKSSEFQNFWRNNQSDKSKFATAISLEKYLQENQKGLYDPKSNPIMGIVSSIKNDTNIIAGKTTTPQNDKTTNIANPSRKNIPIQDTDHTKNSRYYGNSKNEEVIQSSKEKDKAVKDVAMNTGNRISKSVTEKANEAASKISQAAERLTTRFSQRMGSRGADIFNEGQLNKAINQVVDTKTKHSSFLKSTGSTSTKYVGDFRKGGISYRSDNISQKISNIGARLPDEKKKFEQYGKGATTYYTDKFTFESLKKVENYSSEWMARQKKLISELDAISKEHISTKEKQQRIVARLEEEIRKEGEIYKALGMEEEKYQEMLSKQDALVASLEQQRLDIITQREEAQKQLKAAKAQGSKKEEVVNLEKDIAGFKTEEKQLQQQIAHETLMRRDALINLNRLDFQLQDSEYQITGYQYALNNATKNMATTRQLTEAQEKRYLTEEEKTINALIKDRTALEGKFGLIEQQIAEEDLVKKAIAGDLQAQKKLEAIGTQRKQIEDKIYAIEIRLKDALERYFMTFSTVPGIGQLRGARTVGPNTPVTLGPQTVGPNTPIPKVVGPSTPLPPIAFPKNMGELDLKNISEQVEKQLKASQTKDILNNPSKATTPSGQGAYASSKVAQQIADAQQQIKLDKTSLAYRAQNVRDLLRTNDNLTKRINYEKQLLDTQYKSKASLDKIQRTEDRIAQLKKQQELINQRLINNARKQNVDNAINKNKYPTNQVNPTYNGYNRYSIGAGGTYANADMIQGGGWRGYRINDNGEVERISRLNALKTALTGVPEKIKNLGNSAQNASTKLNSTRYYGNNMGGTDAPGFYDSMRKTFVEGFAQSGRYIEGGGKFWNWMNMGMTGMVDWEKIRGANVGLSTLGKVSSFAGGALGSLGMMLGPFEIGMMGLSLVMQGVQAAQQKYKEELEKINSQLSEARENLDKAEEAFLGAYEEQNPKATQDQKDEALLNLYANGSGDRNDGLDSYRAQVYAALCQIEINTRKKAEKENDFWWGSQGGMQKHLWSPWDEFWGIMLDNENQSIKNELDNEFAIALESAKTNKEVVPRLGNNSIASGADLEKEFNKTLGFAGENYWLDDTDAQYKLNNSLDNYANWIDDLEDYTSQAKYSMALMTSGMDSTGVSGGSEITRTYGAYNAKMGTLSNNGIADYKAFENSLSKIPDKIKTQIADSINMYPDFYKSMQRQMFTFKDGKLQRVEGKELKVLQAISKKAGHITNEQAKQTLILSTLGSIHDFVQNNVQPQLLANVEAAMQSANTLGLTYGTGGYTGSATSAVHQGVMVISSQLVTLIEQKSLETMSLLSQSTGIEFGDLTGLARAYDSGRLSPELLAKDYDMKDASQARSIVNTMQGMYTGVMTTTGWNQEDAYKRAEELFSNKDNTGLWDVKTINGQKFMPEIPDMFRTFEPWAVEKLTPYIEEQWVKNNTDTTGEASGPTDTGKDKDKSKDSSKDANKKNWVNLAICNKKEIPKLNVNLFKKPPNFTILNRNFKLRDVNVNTADDAKSIQNAVKNSIIEIQNRSNPKIIQDDAAEYDPLAATEGNTLPTGTKKTE